MLQPPETLSWFGSLPDTAKDSTSCSWPSLATALCSGGRGRPHRAGGVRMCSWTPGSGRSPAPTAPVGWDGSCPIKALPQGGVDLPPTAAGRPLKMLGTSHRHQPSYTDTCRGLPGAPVLHCNSSRAVEDGFPRQDVQIEMLPALPKASIKVPLLPSEVLITQVPAAVRCRGEREREERDGKAQSQCVRGAAAGGTQREGRAWFPCDGCWGKAGEKLGLCWMGRERFLGI